MVVLWNCQRALIFHRHERKCIANLPSLNLNLYWPEQPPLWLPNQSRLSTTITLFKIPLTWKISHHWCLKHISCIFDMCSRKGLTQMGMIIIVTCICWNLVSLLHWGLKCIVSLGTTVTVWPKYFLFFDGFHSKDGTMSHANISQQRKQISTHSCKQNSRP